MNKRIWMIAPLLALLSSCNGKTLQVGTGPSTSGQPGTMPATNATGAEATGDGGTCVPSDCYGYSFTCSEGSPTNVQCVVDKSPQFATPMCTLTGECAPPAVATCSWTPPNPYPCTDSSGPCPATEVKGGEGVVSVEVSPSSGGGSKANLQAYFNVGVGGGAAQTLGACVYDPDGANQVQSGIVGAPAPNPGMITVSAPGSPFSVNPACDGTYAPETSSETMAAGALVSFAWASPANTTVTGFAGGGTDLMGALPSMLPSVPAPHFITLGPSDALAVAAPVVPRANDLPVGWTVTGTPLALEQVVVLLTQGNATVTCAFSATSGSGVVPADVLLKLGAGSASYDVHSLHDGTVQGSEGWDLDFEVEMVAATPTGLATGTLTLL